jgi:uncharacterized protein (TIGR00266 family)
MRVEILYPGAFAMARIQLEKSESAKAESGAMVSMSASVDLEGKLEGGMFGALKRKLLTGEKFFFQTLKAVRGDGEVLLAPTVPGDVALLEVSPSQTYTLQKDAFLAASQTVEVGTKTQSFAKGLFSGEGFFVLEVHGQGTLLVSSFGAIHRVQLAAGQEYVVDNSHLVAWSATTEYEIRKASSGWMSSITSGEGLVCHFRGPGLILLQTRNPDAFGSWMRGYLPSSG